MKNRSLTVVLAADRDDVFSFLALIDNLPRWAPQFCRDLRQDSPHWRATTPGGEDFLALVSDPRTGVIDLFVGAQRDELTLLPLRVVRRPHGCAVLCTFFQPADWADELYERYHGALLAGLRGLAARFPGGELSGGAAAPEPFHASLVTAKFYETWDFYAAHLGFRTVCESDTYVHLVHPLGAQLGLLRAELDGPPAELVSPTDGRGFWLNLNVPDVDAEHARLSAAGVEIADQLEDKPWGHRQFVVRDPNGVLIAIAHRVGVTAEGAVGPASRILTGVHRGCRRAAICGLCG